MGVRAVVEDVVEAHADAVIETARELYLSLGAQTYVVRCERELKAGGLHQLRGSRDSVELTPQEEAVAALVGKGLKSGTLMSGAPAAAYGGFPVA